MEYLSSLVSYILNIGAQIIISAGIVSVPAIPNFAPLHHAIPQSVEVVFSPPKEMAEKTVKSEKKIIVQKPVLSLPESKPIVASPLIQKPFSSPEPSNSAIPFILEPVQKTTPTPVIEWKAVVPPPDILIKDVNNLNAVLIKKSIDYWYIGNFKIQAGDGFSLGKIEYESDISFSLQIWRDNVGFYPPRDIIQCKNFVCTPDKVISLSDTPFSFVISPEGQSGTHWIKIIHIEVLKDSNAYAVGGLPSTDPNFTFTISQ